MKHLLFFLLLLTATSGYTQTVKQSQLLGLWHLDKMIQDSVCVFNQDDSTLLIGTVFAYAEKMNQHLTAKDSAKILAQCRKKADDNRHVFIQFLADGTSRNRHIKPGPEGGVTDNIETGTYVFDKKEQTLQYSGSPKMAVQIIKKHLYLTFTLALLLKHQQVTMVYVK